LIVEPVNRRGLFAARLAEDSRILCKSRTPFTDAARSLLREGVDPKTILISRKPGQDYDALRSTVGAAAKLTVDESKTRFARWKPIYSSAVAPSIDHSEGAATTLPAISSALLRPPLGKPSEITPLIADSGAAGPTASSTADRLLTVKTD
jgi:hypothetical protein